MDRTVAPGDDFGRYVNGTYLKNLVIPEDQSRYGMFTKLRDLSQERTRGILEAAATRIRGAKRILLATPFVLCSLLVVLRTVPTFRGRYRGLNTAGFDIPSLPPWRYLLTEWHVMVVYLRLLFWPAGQNLDWDFPLARGPGDPTPSGIEATATFWPKAITRTSSCSDICTPWHAPCGACRSIRSARSRH